MNLYSNFTPAPKYRGMLNKQVYVDVQMNTIKPFVKWAGGKTKLYPTLKNYLPEMDKVKYYVEPFLGAGGMFINIAMNYQDIKGFMLNDANADMINAWRVIRDDVEKLIIGLEKIKVEFLSKIPGDREEYYCVVKDRYNFKSFELCGTSYEDRVYRAVDFIFLNKTCFNGLYRVNSVGQFNVPFANPQNPGFYDAESLRGLSKILSNRNVTLQHLDYSDVLDILDGARYGTPGTFVYLDPPYLSKQRNNFTSYTVKKFGISDHETLKKRLEYVGYQWMQSNSVDAIELYQEKFIHHVNAARSINSDTSRRGAIEELVITNYQPMNL